MRPLVGSSAATIVIFFPLAFLTGVTGAFFKALSITMAIVADALVPRRLVAGAGAGRAARRTPRRRSPNSIRTGRMLSRLPQGAGGRARAPADAGRGRLRRWPGGGGSWLHERRLGIHPQDRRGRLHPRLCRAARHVADRDGPSDAAGRGDHPRHARRRRPIRGGPAPSSAAGSPSPTPATSSSGSSAHGRRPIETVMNDDRRTRCRRTVPGLEIETAQLMEDLIGDLTAVPEPIEVKLFSADATPARSHGPRRWRPRSQKIHGVTETKSGVVIAGDGLNIEVDPVRAELEGIDAGRSVPADLRPCCPAMSRPRCSRASIW